MGTISILAILVASCLTAMDPPAAGAPGDAGTTVHRFLAGAPDARGWCTARSTGGHFTVRVPARFNDATIRETGGPDERVAYTIGARRPDGVKFSATEMVGFSRKSPDDEPKAYADSWREQPGWTVADVRQFPYRGHPAVELLVRGRATASMHRVVALPNRNFLLVVEYPHARQADVSLELIREFFDSLEITVEPDPAPVPARGGTDGRTCVPGAT